MFRATLDMSGLRSGHVGRRLPRLSPLRPGGLGVCKCTMNAQSIDPGEVAKIAGHEFEVVMDCRCRDLEIRVRELLASLCEIGVDLPEQLSGSRIVGQDGDRWKQSVLDVL